jgi:pimeloyl-ACP methyl ester carboxylesterase
MKVNVNHDIVRYASTNGLSLAYESFGRPDGSPLLLIQGLSSQMIMWEDDFCATLAARGFRVIRFDNRDVGLSTKFSSSGMPHINALLTGRISGSSAVPYTLADMALDALGLLDELGIAKTHVVGQSMGGMTGDPRLPGPRQAALEMMFRPIPMVHDDYVIYFSEVWQLLSGPRYPMDRYTADRLGSMTFMRGVEPAASARQFAAIIASGSRKERLASVTVPTLVIHGSDDPLVPVEGGIDTARSIPGARLMIVEGMGHYIPKQLWHEIIDAIACHAGKT